MTDQDIMDVVESIPTIEWDIVKFARIIEQRAKAAIGGVPIYQMRVMGSWIDVPKLNYDSWPHGKRIVYAENVG